MKKIFTFFILLFTVTSLFAQKHEIGIIGGINQFIAQKKFYPTENTDIGSSWGISYQKNLQKGLSIYTNLIWNTVINHYDIDPVYYVPDYANKPEGTYIWKETFKRNALIIPVLAKWSFGEKTKFFINGGPQLQFYRYTKINSYYASDIANISFMESNKSIYHPKLYMYFTLGTGVSIPVGKKLMMNYEGRVDRYLAFNHNTAKGINIYLLGGLSYKI